MNLCLIYTPLAALSENKISFSILGRNWVIWYSDLQSSLSIIYLSFLMKGEFFLSPWRKNSSYQEACIIFKDLITTDIKDKTFSLFPQQAVNGLACLTPLLPSFASVIFLMFICLIAIVLLKVISLNFSLSPHPLSPSQNAQWNFISPGGLK